MQTPDVLLTGIVFGEQPRWHDGRLWFSDWGTQEVTAVDPDGTGEVVYRGSSFPLWVDWLPDGRRLAVDTSTSRLLVQEADGSLEIYADLRQGSEVIAAFGPGISRIQRETWSSSGWPWSRPTGVESPEVGPVDRACSRRGQGCPGNPSYKCQVLRTRGPSEKCRYALSCLERSEPKTQRNADAEELAGPVRPLRIGPNLVAPRRQRERIYTASSAAPRGRGHEKVALSGDLSAAASRLRDVPALAGLGRRARKRPRPDRRQEDRRPER